MCVYFIDWWFSTFLYTKSHTNAWKLTSLSEINIYKREWKAKATFELYNQLFSSYTSTKNLEVAFKIRENVSIVCHNCCPATLWGIKKKPKGIVAHKMSILVIFRFSQQHHQWMTEWIKWMMRVELTRRGVFSHKQPTGNAKATSARAGFRSILFPSLRYLKL